MPSNEVAWSLHLTYPMFDTPEICPLVPETCLQYLSGVFILFNIYLQLTSYLFVDTCWRALQHWCWLLQQIHSHPSFQWPEKHSGNSMNAGTHSKSRGMEIRHRRRRIRVGVQHIHTDDTMGLRVRVPRSNFLTTALSQTTDILSSMPLVPSGIKVKLSLPTAFWAVEKLAWALEVTWRSPLENTQQAPVRVTCDISMVQVRGSNAYHANREVKYCGVEGSGLRGGLVTKAAAMAQSLDQ